MSEKLTAWFNGKPVEFEDGQTILEVARANKIFIPTLCAYMPLDHKPGTCRMCLVDVKDPGDQDYRIVTACTTPLKAGHKVLTRVERVRRMQRMQMELIFADHDQDCKSCLRHGDCELQDVALFVGMPQGVSSVTCPNERDYDDSGYGIVRDVSKCIRCGRCVEVCRQVQGIGALTLDKFGLDCGVAMTGGKQWADSSKCIECGQCTLVCPTGALTEKDQTDDVLMAIDNPKITTIVEFAPAVRVTLGEEFGLEPGVNVEKRIVSALRTIGVDYVMDTNFAADMVIMEEGTELLERLKARAEGKDVNLPMFTSCCPGWINYVEKHEPAIMDYLSTTKSPQAVFGALAKKYLPEKLGIARENLRVISIMPCTAKKGEAARPNLTQDGNPDVDIVLTVRELARLIRRAGLHLRDCEESEFDTDLFTTSTGAAVIFGSTGGVMEAAVRTLYALTHDGKTMDPLVYEPARGLEGVKQSEVDLGELGVVRLAIVHGMARTQDLIAKMAAREVTYDFVEVMACPGGCIAGGGNPRKKNHYQLYAHDRQNALYEIDAKATLRESHKNPQVLGIYEQVLGHPGSHIAHELMHCEYRSKKDELPALDIRKLWQKLNH